MRSIKEADNYIIKFLYKKQIKADITYTFFLLFSAILAFATSCHLAIGLFLTAATLAILSWTIRELKSKKEINRHNHAKVRVFYIVALVLYILLPSEMMMIAFIFIIPNSVLFISLTETYCGHDNLHWPYIYHLIFGSVWFVIANVIKIFIPNDIFQVTNLFLVFYRPLAITMIIDTIACELVDLRTMFKVKIFRDEIIACYDELTKTHNRYGILEFCDLENATSVAMIDLDNFKQVNDTYSHSIGDLVLKEFAKRLLVYEDDDNFICRWGGEEFIIVSNSKGDLTDICTKFLLYMRNNPIVFNYDDKNILHTQTFSCGIADIVPGKALDELVKLADIQAYLAKANGRNHIYVDNEQFI